VSLVSSLVSHSFFLAWSNFCKHLHFRHLAFVALNNIKIIQPRRLTSVPHKERFECPHGSSVERNKTVEFSWVWMDFIAGNDRAVCCSDPAVIIRYNSREIERAETAHWSWNLLRLRHARDLDPSIVPLNRLSRHYWILCLCFLSSSAIGECVSSHTNT
jgi:hypothetical protein